MTIDKLKNFDVKSSKSHKDSEDYNPRIYWNKTKNMWVCDYTIEDYKPKIYWKFETKQKNK